MKGKSILLNLSGSYEPIAVFGSRAAHPWDDSSPQQIREVLLDSHVAVSPQLAFLFGGNWGSSQAEREPSSALAQRRGLVPVLDSTTFYCYGLGTGQRVAKTQAEAAVR